MTRNLRSTAAASAVVALGALAGVVSVGAASAKSAPKVQTNRTFAGYEITEPTRHIKSATVSFVVPKITCQKDYSGVGPSVLINSTVVKRRYSDSGGGIAVTCQDKVPEYVALPIVDGVNYNDLNVAISAGDRIKLTVAYGSQTVVTLTDETTHQVDKRTGKKSVGETAYFGDSGIEVNHRGLGLDPFTTTSFTAATVDGKAIGKESPQRFNWVDNKKVVLVSASAISHEDDFETSFKHSS